MKKAVCLIFSLFLAIQFSKAQTAPSEIFSAFRYYNSDKTPTGSGFKMRHFINIKSPCLFSIYSDHITFRSRKTINYKIYKMQKYTESKHYWVKDADGQYFQIGTSDWNVTIEKTDKNGKGLAMTLFNIKRIK